MNSPVVSKPPLRNVSGGWARNDKEKGNLFINHLKNVFTPNAPDDIIELSHSTSLNTAIEPLCFDFREIDKAIVDLNSKKAPGIDKISNKMLLELPRIALRIILFIFNAILRLEYYPSYWKVSLIKMILKPGKDHTKVKLACCQINQSCSNSSS